jgi:LAO/AO transport system kinase
MAAGVRRGDRAILGRAITMVESLRADHQKQAQELLQQLLPQTGKAHRIGVTGVPGVGKSTFIESLGQRLCASGRRVAVLAIDPSSARSGGSILGDKTRMIELARNERAFVRPSPTGGTLGGVARKTRESMLLCEAAGYDVVLVETVGVGQSETFVAHMVDSVLLLLLPGAGDELQGIKRGIVELMDLVAINKADGENLAAARQAKSFYLGALKHLRPRSQHWTPPVLLISALEGEGLDALWEKIETHRQALEQAGELEGRRRRQQLAWMWSLLQDELLDTFRQAPSLATLLPEMEEKVQAGRITPALATSRLLERFMD